VGLIWPRVLESALMDLSRPDFGDAVTAVAMLILGAQAGWAHVKNTVSAAVDDLKVP
jgi:hypothetical protein